MFEGEKTWAFWIGLIILGAASVCLFAIIWFNIVLIHGHALEFQVPFIVASVVFILIGLYMMMSGARKEK
jgi:hypothetical protein